MPLLLTDKDLRRALDMGLAIEAVESALRERSAGTAVSLPRTGIDVGAGRLVFTPGGFSSLGRMGLRIYPPAGDQLVAVWDTEGHLDILVVGQLLGAIRTGAIGGVALKHLAPTGARRVGVVGAGLQAYTQLLAAQSVRPIAEVRIFRRNQEARDRLAEAWSEAFSIPVIPVGSAREAVAEAEIVITAAPSATPVIEAAWLRPGVHVSSLGPKYRGRSELGLDLVELADRIYCDFPEQYRREEAFMLHGTPHLDRVRDLTEAPGTERLAHETTLFLSHGLAGTEVAVAASLARRARELGLGQEIRLPDRDQI